MNQLAVVTDELTERRRAAARKAVETRRARAAEGVQPSHLFKAPAKRAADDALAAYEREAQSDSPDWHRAALLLRQALEARPSAKVLTIKAPKVAAIAAPVLTDYPVNKTGSFSVRTDVLIVTFADGEIVRAPATSIKGKPTNVGRGLRMACTYYQARATWRRGKSYLSLKDRRDVPAITACVCEDTGESFNPELCTMKTIEIRQAMPS